MNYSLFYTCITNFKLSILSSLNEMYPSVLSYPSPIFYSFHRSPFNTNKLSYLAGPIKLKLTSSFLSKVN